MRGFFYPSCRGRFRCEAKRETKKSNVSKANSLPKWTLRRSGRNKLSLEVVKIINSSLLCFRLRANSPTLSKSVANAPGNYYKPFCTNRFSINCDWKRSKSFEVSLNFGTETDHTRDHRSRVNTNSNTAPARVRGHLLPVGIVEKFLWHAWYGQLFTAIALF